MRIAQYNMILPYLSHYLRHINIAVYAWLYCL
nr:MAG TPA: hypothetical protein [Caudoviricetes sp.]